MYYTLDTAPGEHGLDPPLFDRESGIVGMEIVPPSGHGGMSKQPMRITGVDISSIRNHVNTP
jgi:hypothetical protein